MKRFIRKCFYLKMCFLRTQSYYSFLSSNVNLFITMMIFLRVYSVKSYPVAYSVSLLVFILFHLVLGHLDMKMGLFKIENEIANEHNPQLLDILKMVKEQINAGRNKGVD